MEYISDRLEQILIALGLSLIHISMGGDDNLIHSMFFPPFNG